MARRHDVPRRRFGAAVVQSVFVCLLVIIPKLAFLDVLQCKLPVLLRVDEPCFEAPLLLLFADVQEELQNDGPQFNGELLEPIDLIVPCLQHFLRQRFLVLADAAAVNTAPPPITVVLNWSSTLKR